MDGLTADELLLFEELQQMPVEEAQGQDKDQDQKKDRDQATNLEEAQDKDKDEDKGNDQKKDQDRAAYPMTTAVLQGQGRSLSCSRKRSRSPSPNLAARGVGTVAACTVQVLKAGGVVHIHNFLSIEEQVHLVQMAAEIGTQEFYECDCEKTKKMKVER
jgi:hypothetical protein